MKYIPIYNVSDLSFCFFDWFRITLCSMNSHIFNSKASETCIFDLICVKVSI